MLHYYHSNQIEQLFEALSGVLNKPLSSVFAPETVLVQNYGMARWMSQQIAEQHSIAANLNFAMPASFIWQQFEAQLDNIPDTSSFDRNALLWRSMFLLPSFQKRKGFEEIQHYLSGSDAELKTYQLSNRIADLFFQYMTFRPDFLEQWESGKESHWQAQLWRGMRENTTEPHRASLLATFQESLQKDGYGNHTGLERLSIFGISSLSPAYFDVFNSLSKSIDVHLFLLNPSLNYWGDIVSEQDLVTLRKSWARHGRADVSELYTVGNPLLASLGKQARDFLDQIHEYEADEHDYFEEPKEDNLLARVQSDILYLLCAGGADLPKTTIKPDDNSIQVHSCHSPMREVQVLHDQLLALFESHSDLLPQDIVVMAPNMDQLAPYIEAVFGGVPVKRHIPYSVADLNDAVSHPLIETFLTWLRLPMERFESSSVLSWLELPAVQRRFELSEDAIERIRHWVSESGIRWGLGAEHKSKLGLSPNDENTWEFGLRRLLLGYALPTSHELYGDVAPFTDIEGAEALWLGQLQDFLERLIHWQHILNKPVGIIEWQHRINNILDDFFLPNDHEELIIKTIRDSLDGMVRQTELVRFTESLDASIVREHLLKEIGAAESHQRFLTGRVTFCNMVPMRTIPFRVLCLIGMNDQDYPRIRAPLGFDLIAQQPRKGDSSRREDDRYLFLESILSARDVLYVSYTGRSQRDNSAKLPSVVVSELLDYIEQGYQHDEGDIRKHLVIEHPLQPYSTRNFEIGSFAAEWLERVPVNTAFAAVPLPPLDEDEEPKEIELHDLIRFLMHPARYFLQHRLSVSNWNEEDALEDSESFALDPLLAYQIKNDVLSSLLAGDDIDDCYRVNKAQGELPHGAFGEVAFRELTGHLQELSDEIRVLLEDRQPVQEINLDIDGIRLVGWVRNIAGKGILQYRPTKLKGKDKLILWVEHLALCVLQEDVHSVYFSDDDVFRLAPVDKDEAIKYLSELVSLYQLGQTQPAQLFSTSSEVYVQQISKGKTEEEALEQARKKWFGNSFSRGESEDADYVQAFRGREVIDDQFQSIAELVFTPMLRHQEKA